MADIGIAKQLEGEAFASGGQARYYEPIDSYEGKHRWDPEAEWSDKEEQHIVRKLDVRICSWVCLMFFALQLDRGNIAQALTDNLLSDLRLDTNQYNYGQTIFYICFLCAELPSQMISKKLGPDNWIPIQMVSWSIVAICQCRLTGQSSFYATRGLLGLIEGGFIPDVILYLSYFYKSKELPIRLSFFWGAYILTQVVSAFLAFGILRLRGHNGWEGWRWLFALEGILTALIGIASWYYLPPSPTQTASRFRGKSGWFTEREEIIMVNRILRDDPSKGDMHNRQGLNLKLLWQALTDWDLFPVYLLGFTWTLHNHTIQSYLTLTLRSLGFDTFTSNLLTIPASMLLLLQLIFWTWLSERINNRFGVVLFCQIWMLPLIVSLAVIPASYGAWARYALLVLAVGFPYVHAIIVAITSRNAGSVRTRTVGSALYNMSVQASSIIASNIYQENDKPLYRKGNRVLIGITIYNIVLIVLIKCYYMWRNSSRDKIWRAMSDDEKQHYLETTKDEGNKRLDFRFAH
ncbi:major facilitator superfamily domain-containing protein [Podospora didyma]|uniref:Major facilitator superfamily domain-containing protein n=1 Tax=Podospora didyma TaxID=330526 RepID=A0AAE0U5A9_9PEZI|nr:major facilitator superfamily domain-containing protein [Podospora didyma]